MKITACSIVKNEAHNIAKSIESYKNSVDEIIIVDTGSDDDTVEICKQHGATVLLYQWNNDFAAAKNYALDHASGDWVIFLDADEWFVPKLNENDLSEFLKSLDTNSDALMMTMCQYNAKTDKISSRNPSIRIFRNSNNIRYKGSIHERLMKQDIEIDYVFCDKYEIYHSGYEDYTIEVKAQRNLDILYDIYRSGKANTYTYFYMLRENYILGNYDEAESLYELFMEQKDADKVIQEDTVAYEFMYRIMAQKPNKYSQKEIDQLLQEAYSKYPDCPMHSYLIGCEILKSDYDKSYLWLENALKVNDNYSAQYPNSFVSYLTDTYYKLGYISQIKGKLEQAIEFYVRAVKDANTSDLTVILSDMLRILENQPQDEIILFIKGIIDTNKKENVKCILNSLKKSRMHKAFIYFAVIYNQKFDEQDETTYIAMILSGQSELVIKTAIEAWKNTEGSLVEVNTDRNSSWHLKYAVVAVLYSKRTDLYNNYKRFFIPEQREIIEAYLNNSEILKIDGFLEKEFRKINEAIYFMLNEKDIIIFKKVFSKLLF